jgi:hypothetical protein
VRYYLLALTVLFKCGFADIELSPVELYRPHVFISVPIFVESSIFLPDFYILSFRSKCYGCSQNWLASTSALFWVSYNKSWYRIITTDSSFSLVVSPSPIKDSHSALWFMMSFNVLIFSINIRWFTGCFLFIPSKSYAFYGLTLIMLIFSKGCSKFLTFEFSIDEKGRGVSVITFCWWLAY